MNASYLSTQSINMLAGTVTKLIGNRIIFKTSDAGVYDAETANASLVRRNGSPMQFSELIIGDRVQVIGPVWADYSINAELVRNMSLYAHTGSFSGKVTTIDILRNSFSIQNGVHGIQTIIVDTLTLFIKQGGIAGFRDIEVGMTAHVNGTWERSRLLVLARKVKATFRLLNIAITGQLVMRNGNALTVVVGDIMYSVDARNARLRSKNNKPLGLLELSLSGNIEVKGKHIEQRTHIIAISIKDLHVSK